MQGNLQGNLQGSLMGNLTGSNNISAFLKPADWPDIRNTTAKIALLATNAAGNYPKVGFSITVTGGYSVYIDGVKYGDYASAAQCNIDWATYTATSGYNISQPSAYVAHIVEIAPKISSNNISVYRGQRVGASGEESQGILWAHFNIVNGIGLSNAFASYSNYKNTALQAITAKNNNLLVSTCFGLFATSTTSNLLLEYLPFIDLAQNTQSFALSDLFCQGKIKEFILKNISATVTSMQNICNTAPALKRIIVINCDFNAITSWRGCHMGNRSLIKIPTEYKYAAATEMWNFITEGAALSDTNLDVSAATGLTRIGCYGTAAYPMRGLKGLKVSAVAPFSGTAPQIDVGYTGLDKAGLVALFNSLPTVSGKTINILGATGAADLTAGDLAIATGKGWTVLR